MGDSFATGENCVSCRTSSYTIQQLTRLGLPVGHVAAGTGYTLEELQDSTAFIPWEPYLVFFENAHHGVTDEQFITLCTSYNISRYLRPLMTAAGFWYDPARYFEWVADPNRGAIPQLFRCLETRFERVGNREVLLEERLRPGYSAPPDLFWESQAIGLGALTSYFGLSPSVVTWEPIDRGAAFRVRLPRRRPLRQLLSRVAAWFCRRTPDDLQAAVVYGHERSLRLEREAAARKRAEDALRASEERLRRVIESIPGIVYQYALGTDGTQGFTVVSGGSTSLTGYCPEELLADPGLIWRQMLPEFVPGIHASIAASARDGTPWHQEFQFQTKGGDVRWVRGHSVPEPPDGTGRVVWNGILTDITAERAAQAALHDRDELLRKLSEQVPGVIYQYRQWPDGRSCFPYASEGIRAVYEVTPDEVRESAATVFSRLHPDDLDAVGASITRSADTLQEWRCEYRVRLPARGERWLEGHSMPERLPDGSTLWHGYIADVTDRKRAEDALRESEERLRVALTAATAIAFVWDAAADSVVRYFSTEPALPANPDAPEPVAKVRAMVHPEDRAVFDAGVTACLAAGPEYRNLYRIVRLDGGVRWLEEWGTLVRDAAGRPARLIGVSIDVTDRKRGETALRESEYRQRLALDAGRMGTWDWDIVHGKVLWDARQQELFGLAPGEYDGHPDTFFTRLHPADAPLVQAKVEHSVATGEDYEAEFRIHPRPGEMLWLAGSGRLIRDPDGRSVRMIGINYDITDRIVAEELLRKSLGEKEALLKEIHHRVKNNLQVISSLLNLQVERIPDPAARAVFLESQSRVRAIALVHETLYGSESLARIKLPRYLDRLCDSVLQTFGGGGRVTVEREFVPVGLELERALPVGLIVSELMSNALKYAFPGERQGRIRVAVAEPSDAEVEVSVSDNGVGLPAELDFDRTTSLGLYLVRVLTRQLRGTLAVGRPEVGATFTLRFPK